MTVVPVDLSVSQNLHTVKKKKKKLVAKSKTSKSHHYTIIKLAMWNGMHPKRQFA